MSISSSSSRQGSSHFSKIYKHASTLFLTRRLPEALSALEPVFTVFNPTANASEEELSAAVAPIASASRSTRIKLWSLYLTLLNAIVELGPEDGKNTLGSKEWRAIVAKVRDGTVWNEVVQKGYEGLEGNVDPDVVINLATLLLAQSPSQTVNQQCLESYLSASSQLNLNISDSLEAINGHERDARGQNSRSNGTNTPRSLNSRIRVLELYILHVLPRNEEWAYARSFIDMCEILDEERREAFSQALQGLEDEKKRDHEQEARLLQERDRKLEQERQRGEQRRLEEVAAELEYTERERGSKLHKRSDSEKDYGIERTPSAHGNGNSRSVASKETIKPAKAAQSNRAQLSPTSRTPPKRKNQQSLYRRSAALLAAAQHLISNMAQSISNNPMVLLRTVLFLVGVIMTFSRRDIRDRLQRITDSSWDKVRRTVGMGVKVSYI
ncbi:MAG: hypothetical protein FRX48_02226 [Lasallia pustulata]|uniref:Peroxin 26 n=1 Tax=Lasallia pustulata TaxID=136370 RepID=A0A5M8PXP3_9LECA|nr:MAG: hypothetical protein FRX48_02226 [Lasallia pustulata]